MSDRPFDRTALNPLEKPLSRDHNQLQSQLDRTLRFVLRELLASRTSLSATNDAPAYAYTGFLGGGMKVRAQSPVAMAVDVSPGMGFFDDNLDLVTSVGGLVGIDDLERWKPLLLMSPATFTVPTAPAGPDTRIDIIEVKADRRLETPTTRELLNVGTASFAAGTVDKILAFALDGQTGIVTAPTNSTAFLSYKTGVAANPGVAPATSPGYTKIGEVNVGSGVVTIGAGDVVDRRLCLSPFGQRWVEVTVTANWGDHTVVPVLSNIIAPPGVRIGAYSAVGPPISITITAIGGQPSNSVTGSPAGADCLAFVETEDSATTYIEVPKVLDRGGGLLSQGEKDALVGAGPSFYGSGLLAAVGDFRTFVSLMLIRASNGGTVAASGSVVREMRVRMPLLMAVT